MNEKDPVYSLNIIYNTKLLFHAKTLTLLYSVIQARVLQKGSAENCLPYVTHHCRPRVGA